MNFLQESLGEKPVAFFPDSSVIRKAERNGQPLTQVTELVSNAPEKLVNFLQKG
jgi:hypothetical protein